MKMLVIGCPGAGKSILTGRINEFLHFPVMHLDKAYYTGEGKSHITKEDLVAKIYEFSNENDNWIIDGNYIGTLEIRVKLADTIILLDIPSDICLANACKRAEESIKNNKNRDDMAEGFDETITEDFADFIKNFRKDTLPRIKTILENQNNKNIIVLNNYDDIEDFIKSLSPELQA